MLSTVWERGVVQQSLSTMVNNDRKDNLVSLRRYCDHLVEAHEEEVERAFKSDRLAKEAPEALGSVLCEEIAGDCAAGFFATYALPSVPNAEAEGPAEAGAGGEDTGDRVPTVREPVVEAQTQGDAAEPEKEL